MEMFKMSFIRTGHLVRQLRNENKLTMNELAQQGEKFLGQHQELLILKKEQKKMKTIEQLFGLEIIFN